MREKVDTAQVSTALTRRGWCAVTDMMTYLGWEPWVYMYLTMVPGGSSTSQIMTPTTWHRSLTSSQLTLGKYRGQVFLSNYLIFCYSWGERRLWVSIWCGIKSHCRDFSFLSWIWGDFFLSHEYVVISFSLIYMRRFLSLYMDMRRCQWSPLWPHCDSALQRPKVWMVWLTPHSPECWLARNILRAEILERST